MSLVGFEPAPKLKYGECEVEELVVIAGLEPTPPFLLTDTSRRNVSHVEGSEIFGVADIDRGSSSLCGSKGRLSVYTIGNEIIAHG